MKNMFVNVSYLPSNNQKEITKKLKLELTTTGYDLCENMRKKLSQLNESLSFDSSQKILKVKSLNDYILNMKTPLSQYSYVICPNSFLYSPFPCFWSFLNSPLYFPPLL